MIDFLLEGGRKRGRNSSKFLLPESGIRGLETVDGAMMTSIIKRVKCWMMIDINV